MASATLEASNAFAADPDLLNSITDAVNSALTMCDTQVRCVGMSSVPLREKGLVTGMIGVHGAVSGFVTVNLAEKVALAAVGGLLQEEADHLTAQIIDGVGEITNLIAGGIKKGLAKTKWAFSNVTVPSVIVGQSYDIAYAKGLKFLSVAFEQTHSEAIMLDERMMQVTVSLLRL
ncbi:MAG: chemotaxis protein CheX [Planctomycetes bacterium]|nr:chemotaxis protein CheX [Planctomycetota bacterium]